MKLTIHIKLHRGRFSSSGRWSDNDCNGVADIDIGQGGKSIAQSLPFKQRGNCPAPRSQALASNIAPSAARQKPTSPPSPTWAGVIQLHHKEVLCRTEQIRGREPNPPSPLTPRDGGDTATRVQAPSQFNAAMLRLQAELSFDAEQILFHNDAWANAQNVFDYGCGDGSYLRKLAQHYPERMFIGVELDAEVATVAQRTCSHLRNVRIICGSLDDVPGDLRFDYFVARLVLLHVPDRTSFYAWCVGRSTADSRMVLIDAADQHFRIRPNPRHFIAALTQLRDNTSRSGGNRNLQDVARAELLGLGFAHELTIPIVVSSAGAGRHEQMHMYMLLTAAISVGWPLPLEIHVELMEWAATPQSHAQYGLFGSIYRIPNSNL